MKRVTKQIQRSAVSGFDEDAYGFEAFYNIALAPGVALTLDGQVINPVFDGVETATILGVRLNIRF